MLAGKVAELVLRGALARTHEASEWASRYET
jgi:hypothetical protein